MESTFLLDRGINRNQKRVFPDVQNALDAAGMGAWEIDRSAGLIYLDEQCQRLLNCAPQHSLLVSQLIELVEPSEVDSLTLLLQWPTTVSVNDKCTFALRTNEPDSERVRWVQFLGQTVADEAGAGTRIIGVAQDVTKQINAQFAALRNQERLETIFYNAPIGLALLRGETHTFELVNDRIAELAGRSVEQMQGKPLLDALPELAQQGLKETFDTVRQTGQRIVLPEITIDLKRNGKTETAHFYASFEPVREPDGSISIVDISLEITQQLASQRALQASESRLRSIVEQAPFAIGVLRGRDMLIETGNARIFEVWGKDGSVVGQRLIDALPEIKGQGFIELLENVYDTGVAFTGNAVLARLVRNGCEEDVYFDFTYTALYEQGCISGIMILAIEVTQQVNAKQALEKSEVRFRGLVNEAPFAIALYETADMVISLANEAMISLWGKTPAVIGQRLADALPELEDQPFLPLLNVVYATGVPYRTQEQQADLVVNGRRQSFWFSFVYQPMLNKNGQVYGILNTAIDVTKQVEARQRIESSEARYRDLVSELDSRIQLRTQELVTSNQDLLRSNDRLHRFAYVASHDLQEPLRRIQSFSTLLSEQYGAALGADGLGLLKRITNSGARMSMLLKDLLAYSTISSHSRNFTLVSLDEVLSDALSELDHIISQRKAEIHADQLTVINGNRSQLTQLFDNLLSNALKFTPPSEIPKINIRCHYRQRADLLPVITQLSSALRFCQIDVIDFGIGFDNRYNEQIFEAFQRLHDQRGYQGSGVGLAICKQVVENHGGYIAANGYPSKGATFSIYLPC